MDRMMGMKEGQRDRNGRRDGVGCKILRKRSDAYSLTADLLARAESDFGLS